MKVQAQVKKPVGEVKDKDGKITKAGAIAPAVTVEYNVPDKLADLSKAFGDDVVAAAAKGAIVISLQAFMRRHIEKGTAAAAIQTAVNDWKPDVRSIVKQTAFEKAASTLDKLTPAERAELLKKLQAANATAKA